MSFIWTCSKTPSSGFLCTGRSMTTRKKVDLNFLFPLFALCLSPSPCSGFRAVFHGLETIVHEVREERLLRLSVGLDSVFFAWLDEVTTAVLGCSVLSKPTIFRGKSNILEPMVWVCHWTIRKERALVPQSTATDGILVPAMWCHFVLVGCYGPDWVRDI